MKTYTIIEELVKDANKTRLANKANWVVFQAQFKGCVLMFKMYNTWVQRLELYKENKTTPFRVESSPMELNSTNFKAWINEQVSTLN
jgi:hypothetical protein